MIKSFDIREVRTKNSLCLEVTIYVEPKARETSLLAEKDELIFLTNEPPTKGRANQSLIKYLSKLLKLPRRNIVFVKGAKSRIKVIRICGLEAKDFLGKISKFR